jgi:hypothetical protein
LEKEREANEKSELVRRTDETREELQHWLLEKEREADEKSELVRRTEEILARAGRGPPWTQPPVRWFGGGALSLSRKMPRRPHKGDVAGHKAEHIQKVHVRSVMAQFPSKSHLQRFFCIWKLTSILSLPASRGQRQ